MVQICLNRTESERVVKEPKLNLTGVHFFLRPNLIVARQSLYLSMGPNGFALGIHNLLEMGETITQRYRKKTMLAEIVANRQADTNNLHPVSQTIMARLPHLTSNYPFSI